MKSLRKDLGMPGIPYRSKLVPYRTEIFILRRERKTYSEIRKIINDKYGVNVSAGGIHNFMKSRIENPAGPLGFEVPNFEEAAGIKPVVAPQSQSETTVQIRENYPQKETDKLQEMEPETEPAEPPKQARKHVIYQPIVRERKPNPFAPGAPMFSHEVPEE